MSISLYQHFRVIWSDTAITCNHVFRKQKEDVVYRSKTVEAKEKHDASMELTKEERNKKIILHYQASGYSYVTVQMSETFSKIIAALLGNVKISAYIYNYQDIKKCFKISSYYLGEIYKLKTAITPQYIKGRQNIFVDGEVKTVYYWQDNELTCDEE
nr:hypothetical protein K-LCC10_0363 [Kaumoebavirus]